jgi:CheY-like chemotaxis protein
LRQVLVNLIGNAIKFTEQGEVDLAVSVENKQDDALRLRFVIRDTGIGMSKLELGGLFQAFTQANVSTTRKYGGTGLGLAISSQLVALLGGEIEVESEEGKGSTFSFTAGFRVTSPAISSCGGLDEQAGLAGEALHEEVVLNVPQNQPLHILLAEDNVVNQKLAVRILEKHGHVVAVANNGKEALDMLVHEHSFDLVLMDVQMPILDGLDATQRIRQQEVSTKRHVPIVAMTANAMAEDREACLEAGMDDYLSKPIRLPELLGAIARLNAADVD